MCRKIYNFLFYVANVFSEAGQHGDNLRTLLDAYRLEKPPKIQSDFPKSITTGIHIVMFLFDNSDFMILSGFRENSLDPGVRTL